jgi:DNA-binding CsgD family transcriptional regulator
MNPFAALAEPLRCRPGDVLPEPPRLRVVRTPKPPKAKPPREPFIKPLPNPWGLSGMQCEIMNRLVMGRTPKEIAEEFCLSFKTIEIHIMRTKSKMDARNRVHAAAMWVGHVGVSVQANAKLLARLGTAGRMA